MRIAAVVALLLSAHEARGFAPSKSFSRLQSTVSADEPSTKLGALPFISKFSKLFNKSSASDDSDADKKRVVVIGNGMVGQRFMENLLDLDTENKCTITTFCEEPRAAYNRVKLTSYFETLDPSSLSMTSDFDEEGKTPWYEDNNVELLLNDKVVSIDTDKKTVKGQSGKEVDYDVAVFATGSYPFVPPIPGKQRPGVFVYRVRLIDIVEDVES